MSIKYINNTRDLLNTVDILKKCPEISLDLEFDKNRYRYGFNLCLIQIFDGSDSYLIDPLEDLDITPVFPLLENPEIQKVVFAFGEDLRLLHSLNCFPKNIYDINIATSLLNYQPASLFNYLGDILGLNMGPSSQQSNWFQRPLTEKQLSYAARDVLYLLQLKKAVHKEAVRNNITHWIEEENLEFDKLNFSDLDDKSYIREEDKNRFSEYEWFLYCRILELRETFAKKHNKPSYQIIRKEDLATIVENGKFSSSIKIKTNLYKGLNREHFWNQVQSTLKQARIQARKLNLSKIEPAEKKLTGQERKQIQLQRHELNKSKNRYLKPIKKKLADRYGQQTASYLLSNRIMQELVDGSLSITKSYKKSLFLDTARELNLDINAVMEIIS